jgi:type I restriction enzyme R subunit
LGNSIVSPLLQLDHRTFCEPRLIGLFQLALRHERLGEVAKLINAEKSDVFDVLAYVAYAKPPISRRAETRGGVILGRYEDKLRAFLEFVLAQYVSQGTEAPDREKLGALLDRKYESVNDAIERLGDAGVIAEAFVGL